MAADTASLDETLGDFLCFTGNELYRVPQDREPVFILVLGTTGSGKSTLVQRCTGQDAGIGHGLRSCTKNMSAHSFLHEGFRVYLVDAPGFDDTDSFEVDTLRTVATYLSMSFANGTRIGGIVYLHRISDNRLGNSSLRNLRMFKSLTGASAWPNTVIGTTWWKQDDHLVGERRERELVNDTNYFGDMISRGAKLFRVAEHGTGVDEEISSSLQMVSYLLGCARKRPTLELAIQRELVLEGKALGETAAGKEALGDLYHLQEQLACQLQTVESAMKEAIADNDERNAREFGSLEESCRRSMQELTRGHEALKASLKRMHDDELSRVVARLDEMESKQRTMLARKRRELQDMEEALELLRQQAAADNQRRQDQLLNTVKLQNQRLHAAYNGPGQEFGDNTAVKRTEASGSHVHNADPEAGRRARERRDIKRREHIVDEREEALRADAAGLEAKHRAQEKEQRRKERTVAKREEALRADTTKLLEAKRRAQETRDMECKESIVAKEQEVSRLGVQLRSTQYARTALKQQLANGVANGATTAVTAGLATAVITGTMCVMS